MIIPIGHENNTVRRLPWVTFAIMAICLVTHIVISSQVKNANKELEDIAVRFIEYYISHPYLEFDEELKSLIFGDRYGDEFDTFLETMRLTYPPPQFTFEKDAEQEELDQLAQEFKTALNDQPYRKWGYIPSKKTLVGLVSHMFIHGGWLHLLGNLLFLYLTGPFIEDVWGRPLYACFYLFVGMVSALMFAQHYPNLVGPLIGASGAIAGVMGAFLIRYWNTKINFFYFIFIFFRGTFKAPAWLMMPMWFFLELFNARVMDTLNPESGGGVAHWAHVWGFVVGVGIAFAVKSFKVEEKYVAPKIDKQLEYTDEGYLALEDALKMKRDGKYEEAMAILTEASKNNTNNDDIVEAMWALGSEMQIIEKSAPLFIKLIEREIRRDQMVNALEHYRKLVDVVPQPAINLTYKIKLMQQLSKSHSLEEAYSLANEILNEVDINSSPVLLMNFASAVSEIDPVVAKSAIELCLQHSDVPEEQKEKLKKEAEALEKAASKPTRVIADDGMSLQIDDQASFTPSGDSTIPLEGPSDVFQGYQEITVQEGEQDSSKEDDPSDSPLDQPAESPAQDSPESTQEFLPDHSIDKQSEKPPDVQPESPFMEEPGTKRIIPGTSGEEDFSPKQKFDVIKASLSAIKEGKLSISAHKVGQRSLPFNKIKAIAAVEITSPYEATYILIDLFIDDPKTDLPVIRTVRMFSAGIDLKKYFPSIDDPQKAMRAFLSFLLKKSGGYPFPDKDSVLLNPAKQFYFVQEYEDFILTI